MRRRGFTEAQVVAILREADKSPVAEIAKKQGISEQMIYSWRQRFGAMNADEVKRLRQLERIGSTIPRCQVTYVVVMGRRGNSSSIWR